MTSRKWPLYTFFGLTVALAFFFFFYPWHTRSASTHEIRIGVISVLSGEFAYIGKSWVNGIELAHTEYLESNPEKSVRLIVEDDGFESARGIAAFKKLTAVDRIDALLNISSPTIAAIDPLLANYSIPVMQWAERTTSPKKDSVFQIQPSFLMADRKLGSHLQGKNLDNPVIVHSDQPVNHRVAEAVLTGYGTEMSRYSIPGSETDFRTHILSIMQSDPSHLVLALNPDQAALFIRQLLASYQEKPELIHCSVFHVGLPSYREILGDLNILKEDLTIMVEKPRTDEFVEAYRSHFNEEPGIASEAGYDAFSILMNTYKGDTAVWLDNIRNFSGTGASGDIAFNEVGLREPVTRIVTVGELIAEQ